ncbi:MAG: DNA repair protein RecO [Verrucomicrobia bacterium]|nr:DNA repair protein RecO [Verrucomicrobiota bacterium]
MDQRAAGVILRTFPLTETSLIVHWLTPEPGRLSTVAKGARRPKSPFRGKLDLFYEGEFSFVRSRRSDLHTLCEVSLRDTHTPLRRELGWLEQAAYAAALIEQTTETESPLPVLFGAFTRLLKTLPLQPPQPLTVFAFEMKLLADLGQNPDLAGASLSAGAKQILEKCLAADWPELFRLKLSPAQTTEIRQFLHGFLIFHLGRIPKGRSHALGGA